MCLLCAMHWVGGRWQDNATSPTPTLLKNDAEHLIPRTYEYVTLYDMTKELCKCDLVKGFEMNRSSWAIHFGPV